VTGLQQRAGHPRGGEHHRAGDPARRKEPVTGRLAERHTRSIARRRDVWGVWRAAWVIAAVRLLDPVCDPGIVWTVPVTL
jgi:hypothetical protein